MAKKRKKIKKEDSEYIPASYKKKRVHRDGKVPVSRRLQCRVCHKLYSNKDSVQKHMKTRHRIIQRVVSRKTLKEEQDRGVVPKKPDSRVLYKNFSVTVEFLGKNSYSKNRELIKLHLHGKLKYCDPARFTIKIENPFAEITSTKAVKFIGNFPRKWPDVYKSLGGFKTDVFNFFRLANGEVCNCVVVDGCVQYLMGKSNTALYLGIFMKSDDEDGTTFLKLEVKNKILQIEKSIAQIVVFVRFKKQGKLGHFFLVVFYLGLNSAIVYDSAPLYYGEHHVEVVLEIAHYIHMYQRQDHNASFQKSWDVEVAKTAEQVRNGPCGAYVTYFVDQLVQSNFSRPPGNIRESALKVHVTRILFQVLDSDEDTKKSRFGKELKSLLEKRSVSGDSPFKMVRPRRGKVNVDDYGEGMESSASAGSQDKDSNKQLWSDYYDDDSEEDSDDDKVSSSDDEDEDLFVPIYMKRQHRKEREKCYKMFFDEA